MALTENADTVVASEVLEDMLGENPIECGIGERESTPEVGEVMHVGIRKPVHIHPIRRVQPSGTATKIEIPRSRRIVGARSHFPICPGQCISNPNAKKVQVPAKQG